MKREREKEKKKERETETKRRRRRDLIDFKIISHLRKVIITELF